MKERIVFLAALAEAVWNRQAYEFNRLVKAGYRTGASREDLLIAVETGRLLGDPPEPVVAQAYATVHAWHWMAIRNPAESDESAPSTQRRRTEPRRASIPCTPR
jgi:hypothetical protein